jgi:hypothetical protein
MNTHAKVSLSDIRTQILSGFPLFIEEFGYLITMVMALRKASRKLTFGIRSSNALEIIL